MYSLKGLGHYIMMPYMSTNETILFFKIVDPYSLKYMGFNQNVMGGQKMVLLTDLYQNNDIKYMLRLKNV